MTDTNTLYGFTPLPASIAATPPSTLSPGTVLPPSPPTTPLASRITAYARSKLSPQTFNHSLRVYSYGLAIARGGYPQWGFTPGSALEETWYLTAMLHDIGTCDEFLEATKLSFEFWGGFHALEVLQQPAMTGSKEGEAPREQAESVAEAIIRHQDVQEKGSVTLITRLVHLATLLDNAGKNVEMVNRGTIESVVKEYPRTGWSGCFRDTVVREKEVKPWAMVSRIEGFEGMIMGNEVMGRYD